MINRCGVRRIGQVAKLPAARAEVRLTRAFESGTVGQGRCRRQGRESVLEVAVREQQGRRMEHENGEREMERFDMRNANTLSHACARCLYATAKQVFWTCSAILCMCCSSVYSFVAVDAIDSEINRLFDFLFRPSATP